MLLSLRSGLGDSVYKLGQSSSYCLSYLVFGLYIACASVFWNSECMHFGHVQTTISSSSQTMTRLLQKALLEKQLFTVYRCMNTHFAFLIVPLLSQFLSGLRPSALSAYALPS